MAKMPLQSKFLGCNLTKISTPYTSYAYDKLNRIIRVVDHNGKSTLYGYDENGNVRMLTDVEGAVTDTYDYDAFGTATATTGLP